ncbi:MAG: DUF2071 domain-containing protein [Polyangiaceae bacterium]
MTLIARYSKENLTRPEPGLMGVTTTLHHFSIVTYAIEPDRLRPFVSPRLDLELVNIDGHPRALISAVSFLDTRFRAARFWTPSQTFCQTNYRAYVIDRETKERAVWFFGTRWARTLVLVPRFVWRLPWHHATTTFECERDESTGVYRRYAMRTESKWAPVDLELEGENEDLRGVEGFDDDETGQVVLTHPLRGYYYRRDGVVGTYSIWHDRLRLKRARVKRSRWGLFERLGLVNEAERDRPHSALIQATSDFTIYLPPQIA